MFKPCRLLNWGDMILIMNCVSWYPWNDHWGTNTLYMHQNNYRVLWTLGNIRLIQVNQNPMAGINIPANDLGNKVDLNQRRFCTISVAIFTRKHEYTWMPISYSAKCCHMNIFAWIFLTFGVVKLFQTIHITDLVKTYAKTKSFLHRFPLS